MQMTIGSWRLSVEREQPNQSELEKIYNRTNWYWDSPPHRLVYSRAYFRLFKRLVEQKELKFSNKPVRVLDCGIGAGLFSEALIRASGNNYDIFGIDLSKKLLEKARKNLSGRSLSIYLKQGSFYDLPFDDGEMDIVISALALDHCHEPADAIREMTRVLRPEGKLVLVLTHSRAPDFLFRLFYRYNHWKPEEISLWMESGGLIDVSVHPLDGLARIFGRAFTGNKM